MTLDPRQLGAERSGERAGQHGLAHAGHILNEEMTTGEGGDGGRHQRALAAEDDPPEVLDQCLAEGDGIVQVAHTLVDDAHRVPAIPWAMGVKTTGARFPAGARPFVAASPGALPATGPGSIVAPLIDAGQRRRPPGRGRVTQTSTEYTRSSMFL